MVWNAHRVPADFRAMENKTAEIDYIDPGRHA
jgi:hypothetical protein